MRPGAASAVVASAVVAAVVVAVVGVGAGCGEDERLTERRVVVGVGDVVRAMPVGDGDGSGDGLGDGDGDGDGLGDGSGDGLGDGDGDGLGDGDGSGDGDGDGDGDGLGDGDGSGDVDGDGVGDVDGGGGEPGCRIGAVDGVCRDVSACGDGEVAVEGLCAGGPRTRCCLPGALAACSVQTAPGACLDVADCEGSDGGYVATAGLCPGPANVRCCARAADATPCDPDNAPTPNDGLAEDAGEAGCPAGMARVTGGGVDVCVDRFEASLVRDDAPAVSLSPYHPPPAGVVARAVSVRWAVPQGNISGTQAAAACAAAGKRLCQSAEWLRACRGPASWTYPYGNARVPRRCNDARPTHPAIERFGTSASWIWSALGDACIAQLPAGLALTGERADCASADGVHDLMGNLHEWVADPSGVFRGGFYVDTAINGEGCLYATTAHGVTHRDYSTGFRCCADPL